MEPRLAQAQAEQRVVFFVDAAHFVLAPFLGLVWSLTRLFIKAPAGRKRFNVRTIAQSLQIELCFLPTYSPKLNLIEWLWKFVKKECLYSQYYADFDTFKTAIEDCLAQTHTTHKSALDSFLSLRFQLFQKTQLVTA